MFLLNKLNSIVQFYFNYSQCNVTVHCNIKKNVIFFSRVQHVDVKLFIYENLITLRRLLFSYTEYL